MSQGSSAPFLIAAAGCDRAVATDEAGASASSSNSVKPPPAGSDGSVRIALMLVVVAALSCMVAARALTSPSADEANAGISEGKLPPGYRDWRLISVAREEGSLDDIRAVLGNDKAIKAYREGTRPFPDGTIIARLAWAYIPSEENNKAFGKAQSFVAGSPKNGVQFMVKDSTKYASTGGWGYSQFDGGKPLTDKAMLQSCFDCHLAFKDRDFVFTHYAP